MVNFALLLAALALGAGILLPIGPGRADLTTLAVKIATGLAIALGVIAVIGTVLIFFLASKYSAMVKDNFFDIDCASP